MPVQKTDIENFLSLAATHPVLDVRSPGEYGHAHIPAAWSLPLFTDEERKVVGTAYKQQSREEAIKIGLDYFGSKMRGMVEQVEVLLQQGKYPAKTVLVHCWRGGMRSAGVAWLLDLYGFKVYTLAGGYKAYRKWVLQQFDKPYPFKILGGYTGSGKTLVLKELERQGETIVDLEQLALHKGSAFGAIGLPAQPSQEMFDNLLAMSLRAAMSRSPGHIWLEDESQRIGLCNLPGALWKTMRQSPVCFLDVPFEARLAHITGDYGKMKKEELVNAIIRIQKRLGGLDTKNAINYLLEDNYAESFRILLRYYDKYYTRALQNREGWNELVTNFDCSGVEAKENAALVKNSELKIKQAK
jgi:tRNA 2-selenouridine synthase